MKKGPKETLSVSKIRKNTNKEDDFMIFEVMIKPAMERKV